MIGKIKKGSGFKGCVNYVLGKEQAALLHAEGVLAESNRQTVSAPVQEPAQTPGKADSPLLAGLGGLFSAPSSPADETPDNPDEIKKKKKKRHLKL